MNQPSEQQILSQVPATFLEKPVIITVDIGPQNAIHGWLQRHKIASKKKTFKITPINLGSIVRISEILLKIGDGIYDPANALKSSYQGAKDHARDIARIVAIAIVNRKQEPSEKLVDLIYYNFSTKDLDRCLSVVMEQMDIGNFTKSIVSVRGMNLLKTSPTDQGSLIASGQQHKEL